MKRPPSRRRQTEEEAEERLRLARVRRTLRRARNRGEISSASLRCLPYSPPETHDGPDGFDLFGDPHE